MYIEIINEFSEKSIYERTGKHIANHEIVYETTASNVICRIVQSCDRLFISSDIKYSTAISDYLNKVNLSEKISSPCFYKEILEALGIYSNEFILEPSEEFLQDISYNCYHTLDYICTSKNFKPFYSDEISEIKRGDSRFILDETFDGTMYCVTKQNRIVSTGYYKPNVGIFDNTCSMQVFTKPEYRNRDYGKMTASAATKHIVKNEKCALWVCQVENQASRKIAEALGYVFIGGEVKITKPSAIL